MHINSSPTYSVTTRVCSLHPHRFRWLLLSSDNAHKIHAPESYETEAEALQIGQAEAACMNWRGDGAR
jgi:hypothetical protein